MKMYFEPKLEVIYFDQKDVITSSDPIYVNDLGFDSEMEVYW